MDQCVVCAKTEGIQRCAACKSVAYCCVEHQKENWKDHKVVCKLVQEANKNGYHKVLSVAGTGKTPPHGATVFLNYKGYFPSGKVFDQSKAGETFSFQLNRKQVIRGWDEAIATMHVGEKATFFISADWAYGAYGHPPVIPPNQPLVFDVEMVKFT